MQTSAPRKTFHPHTTHGASWPGSSPGRCTRISPWGSKYYSGQLWCPKLSGIGVRMSPDFPVRRLGVSRAWVSIVLKDKAPDY